MLVVDVQKHVTARKIKKESRPPKSNQLFSKGSVFCCCFVILIIKGATNCDIKVDTQYKY